MADEKYNDGWPRDQGWYDVLVDGVENRLRHWVCSMSGRHEWVTPEGKYIRGSIVQWIGEAEVRY